MIWYIKSIHTQTYDRISVYTAIDYAGDGNSRKWLQANVPSTVYEINYAVVGLRVKNSLIIVC